MHHQRFAVVGGGEGNNGDRRRARPGAQHRLKAGDLGATGCSRITSVAVSIAITSSSSVMAGLVASVD